MRFLKLKSVIKQDKYVDLKSFCFSNQIFIYLRLLYIHRQPIRNHHHIHRELLLDVRRLAKFIQHMYHQMQRIFTLVSKVYNRI